MVILLAPLGVGFACRTFVRLLATDSEFAIRRSDTTNYAIYRRVPHPHYLTLYLSVCSGSRVRIPEGAPRSVYGPFSFSNYAHGRWLYFLHLLALVLLVVPSSDCSQLTLNLLFVGRTRRITQYTEEYPIPTILPFIFRYAVGPGSKSKRILRGSGAERTSGGCSRPWKTERAVRARLESLKVHQKIA